MEELRSKCPKAFAIMRAFERSRLEEELLATAYEQALPPISRPLGRGWTRPAAAGARLQDRDVQEVERSLAIGGLVG